ncbi:MAG: sulfatase [Candidatus Latescibacteria bacterium]|jgi:arylsulfatase A-like enzyme|nr:sulfatase [Candidatus Latescibacterota bacterium]
MALSKGRPNILVFVPHDLGDHLGCYGHDTVQSPSLDRLAAKGLRLTSYFTAAPECTPSRSGMMTGLYTHQNGLMGLCHRGWELAPEAQHLAQRLWKGGYDTHLFGFQHETGGSPRRLGYNHTHSQQGFKAPAVCGEVTAFLESDLARGEKPWFAHVGFSHVHRPWGEESAFDPDRIGVPPYLPDNPEVRRDLTHFHQSILEMDEAIGGVLQALEGSGLAEDTVVIFTTDHGCPFPRAKSTYYDPGIRLPFIMRCPGRFEGGDTQDALLSNLDFTPTVLELCGLPVPDDLEGRSFLPLLEGKPYEEREAVFGALYYDAFYDPIHCLRTRTHKYIRSFAVTPAGAEGADPEVLATHKTGIWIRADDSDVQSSLSWQSIADGDHPKPPEEELYDLTEDPLEQSNLAGDPAHAKVLERTRRLMQEMMERTSSPLLTGHVSPDLSRTRNQRG